MLIIPASAHEIDTLNTVVQKCMYISRTGNETETPNVQFCWSYLDLVSILLAFKKSEKGTVGPIIKLFPFNAPMVHTNYARWGCVYLADCHQLPPEVLAEFQQGNFVVKRSVGTFNQVDPDQSQEWLNATGKKGGVIVGITRTPSALSRWPISYNLRSHISHLTTINVVTKDKATDLIKDSLLFSAYLGQAQVENLQKIG